MKYSVYLNESKIGETDLEFGDPPMGVVFGKIILNNNTSPYDFFKSYCEKNDIPLSLHDPESQALSTMEILGIRVLNGNHVEIKGEGGVYIEGMQMEYSINILGVGYPFYGTEFPEHVEKYHNQFKKNE